jgi:hypothetical protein
MKVEPLRPEPCGHCSACKKSGNDPWKCDRPWRVGKLLGPLDVWYDPETGLKKSKGYSSKNTSFDMTTGKRDKWDEWDTVDRDWKNGGNGGKSNYVYEKCAHSHPALVIALADGKSVTIYGGSAASPIHKDCDVYVELDAYSAGVLSPFPWEEQNGGAMVIKYPITDMQAPKDPVGFRKMVKWVAAQLLAEKKVHVGCIGGHGRTGTVLAAIVKELTGEVDAISFVRKNYCQKAVESDTQIKFLAKEFGIKEQKAGKTYGTVTSGKGYTVESSPKSQSSKFNERYNDLFKNKEVTIPVDPMIKKGNVWGT